MNAHIVLAHPESRSFNGSLARVSQSTLAHLGWNATLSDLYALDFDPCEGPKHYADAPADEPFHAQTAQRANADRGTTPAAVQEEQQKLLGADLLIVHFPLWWFGMPAILKGWIDRVFVYGAVYRGQMRYDTGICRGKKMLACITTGASEASCSFNGREGDSKLHAWPLLFPFRYIGFDVLEPVFFHGIGGVASLEVGADGNDVITRHLDEWAHMVKNHESRRVTPYNADSEFDDTKRLKPDAPAYGPFVAHSPNTPWD